MNDQISIEISNPPKFNVGDRIQKGKNIGNVYDRMRRPEDFKVWSYYLVSDDGQTRIWCNENELRKISEPKEIKEEMNNFNFRTGGFLKDTRSEKKPDWIKYVYIPELGKDGDKDIDRRRISEPVSEYFDEAQHEFFKPLKRDIEIKDFLSRTEFEHDGIKRQLPYLWANGELIIRQATTLDQAKLQIMLPEANEASSSFWEMSYIRSLLVRGLILIVTDYKNRMKGFQTITTRPDVVSTEDILYLEPESRQKGAFSVIYEIVFAAAEHASYPLVYTQCVEGNPVAEMYEHLGFKRRSEKKVERESVLMFDYEVLKPGHQTFF